MSLTSWVRLLRLAPALSSSATLMFVLDEHLIFGAWMHAAFQKQANTHLPTWWKNGGRGRWGWVLVIFYPINYLLATLNLLVATDRPESTRWYMLGFGFSLAHMLFLRWAIGHILDIENNVPKGNVRTSLAGWLRMNYIRGLTTDLPAWICFITAALKAL